MDRMIILGVLFYGTFAVHAAVVHKGPIKISTENMSADKMYGDIQKNTQSCYKSLNRIRCQMGDIISKRGCKYSNKCTIKDMSMYTIDDTDMLNQFTVITQHFIDTMIRIEKHEKITKHFVKININAMSPCFHQILSSLQMANKNFEKSEAKSKKSSAKINWDEIHTFPLKSSCGKKMSYDDQKYTVFKNFEMFLLKMYSELQRIKTTI